MHFELLYFIIQAQSVPRLRMLCRVGKSCVRAASANASANVTPSVNVTMADHGVAIMALNGPPVNTLNAQLLGDIKSSIDSLVADKASAIVLTSQKPGVFSSGLDIFSMYDKQEDDLRAYWEKVQDMWLSVYCCPVPIIAAINGAAPAGGCQIAMSCDYRIMADHPKPSWKIMTLKYDP